MTKDEKQIILMNIAARNETHPFYHVITTDRQKALDYIISKCTVQRTVQCKRWIEGHALSGDGYYWFNPARPGSCAGIRFQHIITDCSFSDEFLDMLVNCCNYLIDVTFID